MENSFVKKIFCIIISIQMFALPCFALEFDMSVDEEIRKNYNPSKLELESLPPLPNIQPAQTSKPISKPPLEPVDIQTKPIGTTLPALTPATSKPTITKIDKSTAIRIPAGTKFKVKSYQAVSDGTRAGTRISFVSQAPVTKRYVTIQQGTVFKGEVVNSHYPQKTGNGGLIVLGVDSMVFKGSTVGINAKITKAKGKKIFFNNIKGQRKYWKGVANQINKGEQFYKKSRRVSAKFSDNPIGIIIAPIPTITGMAGYAINLIGSPLIALFCEGGRISIPAGSEFEIKLLEDAYLF